VTEQEIRVAKSLGRSLAQARLGQHLTQEQVAEHLGVEQETISRFERGATFPSIPRLLSLGELYGVSIDALIRGSSTRPLDLSQDMTEKISRLSQEDRAWVYNWMNQLCDRLTLKPDLESR